MLYLAVSLQFVVWQSKWAFKINIWEKMHQPQNLRLNNNNSNAQHQDLWNEKPETAMKNKPYKVNRIDLVYALLKCILSNMIAWLA